MWLYTKTAIIAVLAILCVYGGFKVSGWWHEAQMVKAARAELRAEQQRRINAVAEKNTVQTERDAARNELAELRLEANKAKIDQSVRDVKQTIAKHVKSDNPPCDLPDPVAGELQKLREGGE